MTNPNQNQDLTQPQDAGPSENEMPDPQAVDARVQSGEERKSAEAAFGGAQGQDTPSNPSESPHQ